MYFDGINLAEGSVVSNLTVASGINLPATPSLGELFYLTQGVIGLYVYDGTEWRNFTDGSAIAELSNVPFVISTANTSVPNAVVLSSINNGFVKTTDGNISSVSTVALDGSDVSGILAATHLPALTGDVSSSSGSSSVSLVTTGVTPGTYNRVTVDAKGRVTSAVQATTLSALGITDAAPSTHVGATGAAHGIATTAVAGFMSSSDKTKLDGIATNANNYSLPAATSTVLGGVKDGTGVTIAADGTVSVDYGSAAGTAVQGNDARVTADQAAATASIRTLGTGAQQAAAGNHNHTIDGLSNVVITSNTDNEVLAWDSTTSKWINQTAAEAGLATSGHTHNYAGSSTVGGAANSVANSQVIKFDAGTTEGTDLYTFNGSSAKTVDIKAGNNVSITKAAGVITINANDTSVGISEVTGLQTALDSKVDENAAIVAGTATKITYDEKGLVTSGTSLSASDIPNLDASKITSGIIDSARLPSYVDDVLEYTNQAAFPATGESAKIYVAQDTNKINRWTGSAYIEISPTAGNADTATKLATARTISLSGDVTGSVSFDGSSNVQISAAISTILSSITSTTGTGLLRRTGPDTCDLVPMSGLTWNDFA